MNVVDSCIGLKGPDELEQAGRSGLLATTMAQGLIAMSGLFTFGWTASVLVSIMTEFGKLDRIRAQQARGQSSASNLTSGASPSVADPDPDPVAGPFAALDAPAANKELRT